MTVEAIKADFGELLESLGPLEANARDVVGTLEAISEVERSLVLDVFEHEGAVAGRPKWQDLADSTKKKRRKGNRKDAAAYKILQDTGNLVGNIEREVQDLAAIAYTNVPYAVFHVSSAPRKKIPLRDFFAIDEEALYEVATELILATLVKG